MKRLSVVIITFNEEENIGRCIESAKDIADEIVVVDSFSADNTSVIATAAGALVIQHKFEGHIQQKNWAKNQASNDWVLSLDADEALSDLLKKEIKAWKEHNYIHRTSYFMNRLNFYGNQPVKTCGWYPDKKIRLFDKSTGEWQGVNPHDRFVSNDFRLTPGFLHGDILHYTYPTKQDLLNQVEKFATISAGYLKNKSVVYLVVKMFLSPLFKFLRNYIFKLGFTEGAVGWTICYNQSREVFLKYFRAIKLKLA